MERAPVTQRLPSAKEKGRGSNLGPYLKGASLWNLSQNCCCSTSKAVHLWRRRVTSFVCRGATCCLTVMANFFMLFHFSGSSCKGDLSVVRPTLCSPAPTVLRLDSTQVSSSLPWDNVLGSLGHSHPHCLDWSPWWPALLTISCSPLNTILLDLTSKLVVLTLFCTFKRAGIFLCPIFPLTIS